MRLYSLALVQYYKIDFFSWESKTILRKFYNHIPTRREALEFLKEEYAYFVYDKDNYSQWSTYEDYIDTLLNRKNFCLEHEKRDLNTISYIDICQEEYLTLYLEETVRDDYKDANVEYIEDDDNKILVIR